MTNSAARKPIRLVKKMLAWFAVIACMAGYQYPVTFDVTHNRDSTLNEDNRALLTQVDKSLTVEIFTPDRETSDYLIKTLSLFEKENSYITHNVHNTVLSNDQKRQYRLNSNHNLLLTFDNRTQATDINLSAWNENALGNLIHKILRDQEQWVVFLSNHGEQSPAGAESRDVSFLSTVLKNQGLNIAPLNLAASGIVPDNTQVLVIADSQTAFLPEETNQILKYLEQGGNLLWLVNPHSNLESDKLSEHLGLTWLNGTILDKKSHTLGTPDPAVSVITAYPQHPITHQLDRVTVFPWARPLQYDTAEKRGWKATPLLVTNAAAALEAHGGEHASGLGPAVTRPFTIGVTLAKNKQRIVVIGNSHFLSNAGIHNYGNLTLANNLFHWLNEADRYLIAAPKAPIDAAFTQTVFTTIMIQYGFPYGLPILYLSIAWYISRSRRQKYHPSEILYHFTEAVRTDSASSVA